MLRDLTGQDWMDILGLTQVDVPEVVLLRGTRNLRRHYLAYAELFCDVREVGSPNGLFEDVLVGRLGNRRIGYASVYGPAMASEMTHVFGRMGTRVVIQTGVCGSLHPDLAAGDLVIATDARCGEGAVSCYTPGCQLISATPRLVRHIRDALGTSPGVVYGSIWTTAALLAEGRAELEAWAKEAIAVDMETATTFGVAAWTGMESVSVLSVYDNPLDGGHLGLTEHDKEERRAAGEKRMRELVLHLLATA